jgi:hypothetical protein
MHVISLWSYIKAFFRLLMRNQILFFLMLGVSNLLGLTQSTYWFSVNMTEFVPRFSHNLLLIKSIWQPRKQLMLA